MKLVIDASVAVKWLFHLDPAEADTSVALECLKGIIRGRHDLIVPPHWIAEVVAVIARKAPDRARPAVDLIHRLPRRTSVDQTTYYRAADLAARLDRHLFDTLGGFKIELQQPII